MAANPTRKTEVQAYSFEVRRMNSALVRRDPVMLHDPLRTHTRATVVGVILGIVGLLGFLIFGILKPNAKPPDNGGIVIGKESAQVYVYVDNPEMLIPTFNLASARLILKAQQDKAGQGGQQAGGEQITAAVVTTVPDDRLEGIRRGRLQGIPGADMVLPGASQRISDNWAVCHSLPLAPPGRLTDKQNLEQAEKQQRTAVLAGMNPKQLGTALSTRESILVERIDGKRFLIYRPKETANRASDMVMAELPTGPQAESVMEALRLNDIEPRPMSLGLLNSVQQLEQPLLPPVPEGAGEETDFDIGNGSVATVGDVFGVQLAGQTDYYVIHRDGKQRVTRAVANMILYERTDRDVIPPLQADLLRNISDTNTPLQVDDYPEEIPEVLDPLKFPTTCLGWTLTNDGTTGRTTLYTRPGGMPFPKDKNGIEQRIAIGQTNEEKISLDYFYMPPGRGAVVNAATGETSFTSGPIQLITDRGLRYGIPDKETAAYLGLGNIRPAPEAIVKLLPTGVSLNSQDAQRTFDSVPTESEAGDFNGQDTGQEPTQGGVQPQGGG